MSNVLCTRVQYKEGFTALGESCPLLDWGGPDPICQGVQTDPGGVAPRTYPNFFPFQRKGGKKILLCLQGILLRFAPKVYWEF